MDLPAVALIAAASLHPADYYAINLSPEAFAKLGMAPVNLAELSREVAVRAGNGRVCG